MQADAYAGFDELFRAGSIREAACHATRGESSTTSTCARRLTQHKKHSNTCALQDIEASIRGRPAAVRLRIRQEKARPLLQGYEAWLRAKLETLLEEVKPNSLDFLRHSKPGALRK
ncbi:IS66 family transposase [Paraburkholderia sejongensis]|uniref:IS66 family transposase n=1 Tax=Paraburkholderia sejongensis TaxID=2886946 RepID=UPI003CE51509